MTYIFDGSFMGLFTALFEAFERREFSVNIIAEQYYQPQFFGEERHISAESAKAQRVLKGLEKHTSSAQVGQVWRAFLSEDSRVQQAILMWQSKYFGVSVMFLKISVIQRSLLLVRRFKK